MYIIQGCKIYCIGGWLSSTYSATNTVNIYDINNNMWSTGTAMPIVNSSFVCQLYNGKIYCIGGYNGSFINTCYIYNIESDTWSSGNPYPVTCTATASGISNGKIYCIGGASTVNNTYISNLYIYDITSNTWSNGCNMSTVRKWPSGLVYNNKIYIYLVGRIQSQIDLIRVRYMTFQQIHGLIFQI